jgi:hypothetical protein
MVRPEGTCPILGDLQEAGRFRVLSRRSQVAGMAVAGFQGVAVIGPNDACPLDGDLRQQPSRLPMLPGLSELAGVVIAASQVFLFWRRIRPARGGLWLRGLVGRCSMGRMELGGHIAAVRAGVGDPAAMVGELRRSVLLVPVDAGRFVSAVRGGVRWVYAFSGEAALARFAAALGFPGTESGGGSAQQRQQEWEYVSVLGARLLDVVVPSLEGPAGVAVDVADEDGSMLFPPVRGIVPDGVAVDMTEARR